MKEQLVQVAKDKLGEDADAGAIIDFLMAEHVITERQMRRALIRHEFFKRLSDPKDRRTSCEIELDLAADFEVSLRSVQYIRSERRKIMK